MTKGTKVLAVLIAGAMSVPCMEADVSAALDPNDYVSIRTDLSEEQLRTWDEEIYKDFELKRIEIDESAITFSEPYYNYNFYDMEQSEVNVRRIVYENGEIIALSSGLIWDDQILTPSLDLGSFEYLADATENDEKILFGSAIVDGFPCDLVYVDGTIYMYNTSSLEQDALVMGPTDLVFGEIPYCELDSSMVAPEEPATTEPVIAPEVGEPDEYVSIRTDLSEEQLQLWNEEIYFDVDSYGVDVDKSALTFSEPYYCYDFYDMEMYEGTSARIVYENGEIVGLSKGIWREDHFYTPTFYSGSFEYLTESLKNGERILFGSACVDHYPCQLIYVNDTFYAHDTFAFEDGPTDLVFGEIPYSEILTGVFPSEEPTDTTTTTKPVIAPEVGDPNDYASINTNLTEEQLQLWDEEIYFDVELYGVDVDKSALTFSEPYYRYDFYDMELDENAWMRIVFENEEIIGLSYGALYEGKIHTQFDSGSFEYLADALENNGKILFGFSVVNSLPCVLVYADGIIYTYGTVALEEGPTDLVFGEIPYSEYNSGMVGPEDTDTTTTTTTTTTTVPIEVTDPQVGDMNADGMISLMDVIYLQKMNANVLDRTEERVRTAECCADGVINAADVSALLRYIVRFVDALPVIPE